MHAIVAAALAVALLTGCGVPRDPEGTLDRVRDGALRVGLTESEPWTRLENGRRSGVEVRLLERLATELGARIEWTQGAEADLIAALEVRELDLVVGGLTADSPWQAQAALTRPYLTTRTVVATPASQPAPDDIAGLRVAVASGEDAAGLLDKTDAVPVRVDDVAAAAGPVVVDDWLLDDLRLRDTGVHLRKSEHVMAVPLGENAWLVWLERFLHAQKGQVRALLDAEGRP
jgi:polar amino acid transport system substrate-binding protein